MRQRVALAQCLIVRGSILLLDEPFAALDDITRRSIVCQLDQWLMEKRIALVLVTHSFEDAAYLSDRAIFWCPKVDRMERSPLTEYQLPRTWKRSGNMSDFSDPHFSELRESLFKSYVNQIPIDIN